MRWLLVSCGLIGLAAIAITVGLMVGFSALPAPTSSAGQQLLRNYNHLSHGVVLASVALGLIGLLIWALSQPADSAHQPSQAHKPLGTQAMRWCRHHPLLLIVFIAYGVVMVQHTSGFYPELQGWLRDIHNGQLINPFQLRDGLINETMRANSFRFFPLAHQDLHLLSWLTPYVKVWSLVSALELVAIVLLANRAVTTLSGGSEWPGQLWLISLLLLFHPATGWAFFQLIYSERLLTLLFSLFICAVLEHQRTESRHSFALAFGCALVGLFVKDIAVILFVAPAIFTLMLAASGRDPGERQSYALEWWLCGLSVVTIAAYLVLSLLPSLYGGSHGFANSDRLTLIADWRLLALTLFSLTRWLLIVRDRCKANLLDALNLGALAYAAALFLSVGYPYESFWTLPVQLVTVLDLALIWSRWAAPALHRKTTPALVGAFGIALSAGVLALESGQAQTFSKRIGKIQVNQQKWRTTFEELEALLNERRRAGEPRNLIFMQTWFGRAEYERLPYERLIELDPVTRTYSVVDGIGRGRRYRPQPGDLLANIDKRKLTVLGDESSRYAEVYRFRPGMNYGAIYERQP